MEETADLIEDALGDETRTRFFTEAASDPKWIDWLDRRGHLNALFGDETLSKRDKIFSKWLAQQFAYDHADALFLLIGKHNMRLPPQLWFDLGRKIWEDEDFSLARDVKGATGLGQAQVTKQTQRVERSVALSVMAYLVLIHLRQRDIPHQGPWSAFTLKRNFAWQSARKQIEHNQKRTYKKAA